MVSGKYSALSGAVTREQSIANISANLANVSTVGYKKSLTSFESVLRGEKQIQDSKGINYNRIKQNYTDFSQGPLKETANPLDLAILGDGFFKIRSSDGDLLTRKGNFNLDSTGRLVTDTGMPVLDLANTEIVIQGADTNKIIISKTGTISSIADDGSKSDIGQLAIVTITDKTQLKRESDTSFSLKPGVVDNQATEFRISQGSLEISNVNMANEMARMIKDNRTYQAYHNVLKSYSTIGNKLEDLGSLG